MARNAEQNQAAREEAERRLLEAATKVFTRMGYAGARMADIAREAGLSHGLVYHYFPTKEAIYCAVVETTMGYAVNLAEQAPAQFSAIEQLRTTCERMLNGMRAAPTYTLIMLQTSSSRAVPDRARAALRRSTRRAETAFAALIDQAQRDGDIGTGDPGTLARTLLATLSGLAASLASGPRAHSFPSLDLVLRLLDVKRGA